jgi:ArsR family transcriptional regulator
MLAAARRRIEHLGIENVELHEGDLTHLPIDDVSVDLAVAILVLHHVPTPPEAVSELQRILRPGGRVMIVEQTAHHNEGFRDRMQDRWWGFDPDEFAVLLSGLGFEQAETRRLLTRNGASDAPDLFAVAARKVVGDRG